jgi:hypothetical protein
MACLKEFRRNIMVRKFAPLWKYFVVCYYIHKCFADNGVASPCFEGGMGLSI